MMIITGLPLPDVSLISLSTAGASNLADLIQMTLPVHREERLSKQTL
jgi:hypothetical protein